jgi:hypothetical protein
MISASRVSGYVDNLFDSHVSHQGWVRLTISPATLMIRDGSDEWIHGSVHSYIEVNMSENQWAGLVSRMNTSGVPCTLSRRLTEDGVHQDVPQLPPQTIGSEKLSKIAEAKGGQLDKLVRTYADELSQFASKMGKRDSEAFLSTLNILIDNLKSNANYYKDVLIETKEKMVNDAKTEIEGYVSGVINRLGVSNMQELGRLAAEREVPKLEGR